MRRVEFAAPWTCRRGTVKPILLCGRRSRVVFIANNEDIVQEDAMATERKAEDLLDQMFNDCASDESSDYATEKRGFRVCGHSTTVSLERAFWGVIADMAAEVDITVPQLIERVFLGCVVCNDKNVSSCLRVICLKYMSGRGKGAAA
jgi:predicted DNA-binding ribbon-helix-helix protein